MFPKSLVDGCHRLVDEGAAQLNMPVGIVSRIFNSNYQIVAINCGTMQMMDGSVFPLQDTYCRDVFQSGKTIAITEIEGVQGMRLHPLYIKLPLEAYISAPILYRDKVWGTVNFTSPTVREPFTPDEIELVEAYADSVRKELHKLDRPVGFHEETRSRPGVH